MRQIKVGVMFRCINPPELLPEFARTAEQQGYAELWLVEDCFYSAAVATAAVALSATERLPIGIGVLPAVLRKPALTAMELAGLARMFPGRLMTGFGHGVASWMRQVGAFPESQLAALGETVTAVRALLAGELVTTTGRHVRLDNVRLEHPPEIVPPVYTGVRAVRSLRLSGERADGTILSELSSPGYISWAREQIDQGRQSAGHSDNSAPAGAAQRGPMPQQGPAEQQVSPQGQDTARYLGTVARDDHHRLTVYQLLDVGDEARADTRRHAVADLRHSGRPAPAVGDELTARVAELADAIADNEKLAEALPDSYIDQLCLSGTPTEIAAGIEALRTAGADAVVLVPSADYTTAQHQLRYVATEVLPLVSR